MHEESSGIVKFREVGRNFLEVLHDILLVVVLYEVGILYLLFNSNLLHIRSLHEVVRKLVRNLPPGLRIVILHWSDVLHIYFAFDIFCAYIFFSIFVYHFTL